MPLADEQIQSLLGPPPDPATQPPRVSDPRITALGPQPVTRATKARPRTWLERNQSPLIPFDSELESPTDLKTALLMRNKPEDQKEYLETIVGAGNVRFSDDGKPIVTIYDAQKKSPVEFSPLGVDKANVIAHAQAAIPEMAGALTGALLGKKVPTESRFLKFAAEMIGAGVGQEVGGAGKDIAVSSAPLDAIVKERASQVPVSATLNAAFGAGAKVLGTVASPIKGAESAIESDLKSAREYFRNKMGIDYPLSSGEATGATVLKRIEATMARAPGSSANFEKLQQQKLSAFRQIQNKMLSGEVDDEAAGMLRKLEEDVGEDAIAAIREKVDPIRRATLAARNEAVMASELAVMDEVASAAGPVRQLYPEKVGQSIRAKAFAERDKFQAASSAEYEALYQLPGGTEKLLEPPNLANRAKALIREQPSPEVVTQRANAVVGPTGEPITLTTKNKEILREFVPTEAVNKLETLASLERAKFSLRDLVRMRTEVRNDIAKGEAVPGVSTHYLGEIDKALTEAIEESTAAIPDGQLKAAWEAANKNYREGVTRFKDRNIGRLFKDMESGGFVQDEDIVRNIGPTEYESFRKFLGADSPEFGNLKRGILDQVLESSRIPSSNLIDGKSLQSNLYNFVTKNRAVAEDILGPDRLKNLKQLGSLMEELAGDTPIDFSKFAEALASNRNLSTTVKNLVAEQRKLNEVYRSQLVKDIAEGRLGKTFNSTEFVNRYFSEASPKELKVVMEQLKDSPEIVDDLRRKVAERLFFDAQKRVGSTDPARIAPGELFRTTNTSALENAVGNEQNKERLKLILGDDLFTDFEMLGRLLRGGEVAERSFASSGGFAAQMQVASMLRGGVFGYLADWAKQKVGAFIYGNNTFRKLLTNQTFRDPDNQAALARALITSQPFISSMTDDFGSKKVGEFMDMLSNSIDLYEEKGPKGAAAVRQQDWVDQILNQPQKTNRQVVFPAP